MLRKSLLRPLSLTCLLAALVVPPAAFAADANDYVAEARQRMSKGEGKAAMIQLKNALQEDPGHVEARVMLGALYLASNDAASARKEFERAGRLGAQKKRWLLGYAQALLLLNEFDTLLKEVDSDPDLPKDQQSMALAMRGAAYLASDRNAEADQEFDRALAIVPSNPTAGLGKARLLLANGKREEALKQLNTVLLENPKHAESLLARAELRRAMGLFDDARADYDAAVNNSARNVRALTGRALLAISEQRADDAMKDVVALRKINKDLPIANYLHALVAFQKKNYPDASEQLQLVLRSMPANLQAQLLYGVVTYAQGDYTLADEYLSRALAGTPGNTQISKLVAATRLKLRQPERAITVLEAIRSQNPDDAQLLALLGTAYLQNGDNAQGAELMAKAVELQPDQALLRTQLAVGRIASGDTSGAISELESAVDLGQDLVQADVLLVLGYLNQKAYDKAITVAEALEKRMPDSPIPVNLTGLAYMAQEQFAEAEVKFKRALQIDPRFVVAGMNLARMAIVSKRLDEARGYYKDVLQIQPKHVAAMLGLSALERSAGNDAGAEEWLVKANAADPKALTPILLLAELHLKRNEALKAANLLAGMAPEQADTPAALRVKGMSQLQSGEFSSAARTMQRMVDKAPQDIEAWFQLARAQAASGDNSGSRESFKRALALDTENKQAVVWVGLGELELRDKNYDQVLTVAQEMLTRFPSNPLAYELQAAAYRGKGDINRALEAVEQAVRAEGSSKRVNLFAHTLASTGNSPKAVFMLKDWLRDNPDDGVSWTTLGMLHQQMGKIPDALAAYERAIEYSGGNPVVLNNMAWLYLESNGKRALDLARQAYEIAPERAEIADTFGWVQFREGKQQEGLAMLQQALLIAPKNPEITLHVAEALHRMGRDNEARPLVERVINDHALTQWEHPAKELRDQLR